MARFRKITSSLIIGLLTVILFLMIEILIADVYTRYYFKMALFMLTLIVAVINLINTYLYEKELFFKKLLGCCIGLAGIAAYAGYFRP